MSKVQNELGVAVAGHVRIQVPVDRPRYTVTAIGGSKTSIARQLIGPSISQPLADVIAELTLIDDVVQRTNLSPSVVSVRYWNPLEVIYAVAGGIGGAAALVQILTTIRDWIPSREQRRSEALRARAQAEREQMGLYSDAARAANDLLDLADRLHNTELAPGVATELIEQVGFAKLDRLGKLLVDGEIDVTEISGN